LSAVTSSTVILSKGRRGLTYYGTGIQVY